MTRPTITLYLDTVSPFAYVAYYITRNDPVFSNCDVTYVPIFLGGVMKATNNRPPIEVKNKDKWIHLERVRWARLFSVPMNESISDDFPPLTLSIMRALCALTLLYPDSHKKLCKLFDALFHAYWVEQQPTHKPEVLTRVLTDALGVQDTRKVIDIAGKEGKQILAKNTDQALADGAFGLPWFKCTNSEGKTESFWGVDHMGQVCMFLDLDKPKQGGWKAVL